MKQSAAVILLCVFSSVAIPAHAQVAPSASSHSLRIQAGAEFSNFQPDYANQGVPQAGTRLDGLGAYLDADFTRWVQVEAEGRWLHWNQTTGVTQNTYMIGPRVPVVEDWKGLTPYGKFLIGWGSGPFLTGRTTAWAYGGGVDYSLSRKLRLRCVDFEYQDWHIQPASLHPWGLSVGLSYQVF